jgi:RNA polymerase sigma-70 factor, ECF subfamily
VAADSSGVDRVVSDIYRSEWGRILANVIRRTGDFTLAEEATQEAFESALEKWRTDGVPAHPRAWLAQSARNAAIDRLRHRKLAAGKLETYAADLDEAAPDALGPTEIPDDRLRLVFTCCHPSLALEAQVALTLRTLLGLETDEIARAFLVTPETMAQRLVRAKKKIADARSRTSSPRRARYPKGSTPSSPSSISSSPRAMRPRAASRSSAPISPPKRSA